MERNRESKSFWNFLLGWNGNGTGNVQARPGAEADGESPQWQHCYSSEDFELAGLSNEVLWFAERCLVARRERGMR